MDRRRMSKRAVVRATDAVFFVIPMGLALAYWLANFAA